MAVCSSRQLLFIEDMSKVRNMEVKLFKKGQYYIMLGCTEHSRSKYI